MKSYFIIIALCLLASCQQKAPIEKEYELIDFETIYESSLPDLSLSADGDIYLSWVEKEEEKAVLKYSKLEAGVWSKAKNIAEGDNWFVNWADFPSLMVNQDHMAAHWLQKSDEGTYDYDVKVSIKQNSSPDWSPSFTIHNDGISAEHGFASMLPLPSGETFITWLDGRNTKLENGAMTLRAAIFDSNGEVQSRWELDERICDCCQTGAALTKDGPIVIYRDRSENEIRDTYTVKFQNGSWSEPKPVEIELWRIEGCPVNGPQIVAKDDMVAAAWFTAAGGTAKVKLAFSEDAGKSFSQSIVVSEGNTLGRIGISAINSREVIVTWMENIEGESAIMLAKYNSEGDLLKKMSLSEVSGSRDSGFPVITSSNNETIIAWTDTGEKSKVITAKINF